MTDRNVADVTNLAFAKALAIVAQENFLGKFKLAWFSTQSLKIKKWLKE